MNQLTVEIDTCEELCEHSRLIDLAKADMLADDTAQLIAASFKLLADTTRVKILYALAQRELCVCDIAAVVAMGQSAVSHQLRLLRGARMVKYRKEGTMVWYSLDDKLIALLLSQGLEHVKQGSR